MDFSGVQSCLEEAVGQGVFPGCAALISREGKILYRTALGLAWKEPREVPARPDTIYDLASLTKLFTATAALMLVDRGRIGLESPLPDLIRRRVSDGAKASITLRQILRHRSGFPAWRPFFKDLLNIDAEHRPDAALDMILDAPLETPPGSATCYSDLGFLLLGRAVEIHAGMRLNECIRSWITGPWGLSRTFFIDLRSGRDYPREPERFAATERCPTRHRVLIAEVDDENAYALGGVAGHAGLFGTLDDLHRFLEAWRGKSFAAPRLIEEFLTAEPGQRALGWDVPAELDSQAGTRFSRSMTVGHLGFTGTSLWWERGLDLAAILLTNRVHPSRENQAIKAFRPAFHDKVYDVCVG